MIEALQLMPSPAFRFWACLVEMYSGVFSKRSRAAVRAFFLRSTSSWLRALYTVSAPGFAELRVGVDGVVVLGVGILTMH